MLKELVLKIQKHFQRNEEEGQSLVEYGLILALVSIVAILVLSLLGGQINTTVNTIQTVLSNVNKNTNTTT